MTFVPHPTSRCIGCRLTWELCACALAPRFAARTHVLLIMHIKEWRRSSNTGHLLRLSTDNISIRLHGKPGEPPSDAGLWIDETRTRPVVLYPSDSAVMLTRELASPEGDPRPLTLIVPDGTWSQARHIAKRVKGLDAWPRVALPRLPEAIIRPRRNVAEGRMSTFEAVAQALAVLEDDALEGPLQAFFRQFAARTLCMRGRIKPQDIDALVASQLTASHDFATQN